MRRITVEEVNAAYEKTGLQPIDREYCSEFCGCPLTAIYFAEAAETRMPTDGWDEAFNASLECRVIRWGYKKFGQSYHEGFICGVDGGKDFHACTQSGLDGFSDGAAVRRALFES